RLHNTIFRYSFQVKYNPLYFTCVKVGSCRQLIGFSKPMDQRTLMVQLADTRAHLHTILKNWCDVLSSKERAHLYTTFQVVLFSSKSVRKKPPSSVSDRGLFDVKISLEI